MSTIKPIEMIRRSKREWVVYDVTNDELMGEAASITAVARLIGCSREHIYTKTNDDGDMTYRGNEFKITEK